MEFNEEGEEYLFKIVVVGNSNVGKTNIISRYTTDEFSEDTQNTIGVDFKVYQTDFDEKEITIQFWDTAGQEKFRAMTTAYYKNSHGAIIVYDITD